MYVFPDTNPEQRFDIDQPQMGEEVITELKPVVSFVVVRLTV